MSTKTPEQKAAKKAERFERRRDALVRAMRQDVLVLRKIIKGDGAKK